MSWRRFVTHRSSNQFAISDDRPFLGFCSLFAPLCLIFFFSKPTHSGNNGVLYACGNHHGQVDHSSLGSQSLWVEQTCSSPLKCLNGEFSWHLFPPFFTFSFFVFITAFMGLDGPKQCSTLPRIIPQLMHAPPSRTDVHAFRIIEVQGFFNLDQS